MLYWHFRNIQCLIAALFKSRITPTETITKHFWANPFDSDWLQGLQAGRYFTYTDAARWEIAARLGFLKMSLQKKLVLIIGGQKIIYRRPVRIFRRFRLHLRILGWDEKWLYAAHTFEQGGETKCLLFTKIGLRQKRKLYSPILALEELKHRQQIPPQWILDQFQNDANLLKAEESIT